MLPKQIKIIKGDIETEKLFKFLKGVNIVIHLAY